MPIYTPPPAGASGIDGTLTTNRIPFASDSDTLTDDADFVYDSTNDLLQVTKIDAQTIIAVNNNSSSDALTAGTAVYVVATAGTGGRPNVAPADADDATKVPSIGIVTNHIAASGSGYVATNGTVNGLSSSAGAVTTDGLSASDIGKTLYVSTTAGKLTITKPTGPTENIQNVGRVISVNGGNFKMQVSNIGRTNDVPNQIQMRSAPVVTDNSNPSASAADSGKYFYRTSGTTFTLPADSYVGEQYVLLNNTGGAVTIASTGGDTIIGSTSIDDDKAATILCVAANTWFVVG